MIESILRFDEIKIDYRSLYMSLGYGLHQVSEYMIDIIQYRVQKLSSICIPRTGYIMVDGHISGSSRLVIGDTEFVMGKIIAQGLADADKYIVFVATAGNEFNQFVHDIHEEGDIFDDYIYDIIGSEIAEATVNSLVTSLEDKYQGVGMHVSNPYSPGYCGWHVREQMKLFSLLPPAPCGITLNDSCLMTPIKSVSGIIALGKEVTKKPYGCAICNMSSCYKNQHKLQQGTATTV